MASATVRATVLVAVGAIALLAALADQGHAQLIRGRVVDSANGSPVELAAVWLLDRDRGQVDLAMADSVGRYFLTVPSSGEYVIVAERFGYFETESPLLAISDDRDYDLDLELRPEPMGIRGVDVAVRNEQVVDWLTLEIGRDPTEFFGFRVLQGSRLQQAKTRAKFNPTETLRWLFIPVQHGRCVSINVVHRSEIVSPMTGPRGRPFDPSGVPAGTVARDEVASTSGSDPDECSAGSLYVNDRRIPNDRIDSIDLRTIAVVVTLPNTVRMYTYDFGWAFRQE